MSWDYPDTLYPDTPRTGFRMMCLMQGLFAVAEHIAQGLHLNFHVVSRLHQLVYCFVQNIRKNVVRVHHICDPSGLPYFGIKCYAEKNC